MKAFHTKSQIPQTTTGTLMFFTSRFHIEPIGPHLSQLDHNLIETMPILTPKILAPIYLNDDNDVMISREDWEMAG
jgi:hypothetical protein